jgi:hypothetical protein
MDPYYDVQSDTVNLIKQLRGTNNSLQQRQLIAEIENQLVDLNEMIDLISKNRNKFLISDRELHVRKQFIREVKSTISNISTTSTIQTNKLIDTNFDAPPPDLESEVSLQTYVKTNIVEQDQYLDQISRSLDTLKQINYQISDELIAQDAVIDDVSQLTAETEDRLRKGSKKIDQVSASSDTKPQIVGLIALGATVLGLFTALIHF